MLSVNQEIIYNFWYEAISFSLNKYANIIQWLNEMR